ncbi:DUF1707 domain-containing protein [Haloactinopolyspora sp.]|uniref:DUF1707 SHOCT-like domain-containing protein n=1 Tax=Haloactinopolyspora sp. TaxID=1966353 RepID=UPI002619FB46|nr:DUF1707 domain-containing protein [Haloactinopolyspora sp.]
MTPTSEPADRDEPGRLPPTPSTPAVRASDLEREQVVEALSEHATTGRLTLAELEERIGLAYRATTREELDRLVADLPSTDSASRSATEPETRRRKLTKWIVAIMGGTEKQGRWRVAERVTALAIMGGHTIDLRNAELDSDETTIVSISVMGGADIYVPDTVDVEVGGFSIMGGTGERGSTRPPRPGAPRVKILVYNVMGGTDVWRLPEETLDMPLKKAQKIAKKAH